MLVASGVVNNPAIDNVIQSSLESENEYLRLEWIPCSQITDFEPTQIDNVHYAIYKRTLDENTVTIMLSLLGNDEICTPKFVSEFAKTYSLPTYKYHNDISQFRRHKAWLEIRNKLIKGFTKYDGSYYMVADKHFYHCYTRYGF